MWRVKENFKDLEQKIRLKANEEYIRTGRGKKARIAELASSNNKAGRPLIEWVEEGDSNEGTSEATTSD
ncbi:hypothetical protein [Alkalicoccus luteus]|uniref:Uncharacterized protein n=1 Tax=Alkalicoccus luteus TaxID=1237094 RepID=A0A969PRW6_9BACI|nr:hypothetical protein [Alkalicoccus luteus]NJP37919.1 hypothetical protein [Alkalicoccus luteus]